MITGRVPSPEAAIAEVRQKISITNKDAGLGDFVITIHKLAEDSWACNIWWQQPAKLKHETIRVMPERVVNTATDIYHTLLAEVDRFEKDHPQPVRDLIELLTYGVVFGHAIFTFMKAEVLFKYGE